MRDIEFRGKQKDTKEWVYGGYMKPLNRDYIVIWIEEESEGGGFGEPCILETVGQYTGLRDRNQVKIFEGDVIEYSNTEGQMFRKVVSWSNKLLCYMIGNMSYEKLFNSAYIQPSVLNCEIIGNIHDNPELLEAKT